MRRILVAGGGTGGHLFPGLAVVEELRRRNPDIEVLFVGTARGIEARILPARGERLELLEVSPLKGVGSWQRTKSLARLPGAITRAMGVVRSFKPDLVLGVGGYASGPVVLGAALLGVKTALLEQNAYVGFTNRTLASFVGRAYVAFAHTASTFGAKRTVVTGNPVRREFVDAAKRAISDPEGFEARADSILVIGGSQGARALNELVPKALARAGVGQAGVRIVHQTGETMRAEVAEAYQALGLRAEVVPFIDNMARAYANAVLVIGRAGATTVAELCAIGRASILVPYPHAADDHQTKNAKSLEDVEASVSLSEAELSAEQLAATVSELIGSSDKRAKMAEAARAHGRPDAAAAIVDDLFDWLGVEQRTVPSDPHELTRANGEGGDRPKGSSFRLSASSAMRRPAFAPPRRPLVVDGVVWE